MKNVFYFIVGLLGFIFNAVMVGLIFTPIFYFAIPFVFSIPYVPFINI